MLTLPIKRKWFDMIASGEKKEEYRDRSPYYRARLDKYFAKEFYIKLRAGYSSNCPYIVCRCFLSVGKGKKEWGAPDKDVYILTITRIYRLEHVQEFIDWNTELLR